MLNLNDPLYFASVSPNPYNDHFWREVYNECGDPGKFFISTGIRLNPSRFVSRNGEWSLPWKQSLIPGFEMPEYDSTFNKSFAEVTDAKASSIQQQIRSGKKFVIMYSGGIDSTVIVVSLLKNLSKEELENITIAASADSIIENPMFWKLILKNNLKILDSGKYKYDDLIESGLIPITADEGDSIFGTLIGLSLYNNFDYYIKDFSPGTRSNLMDLKYRITDPEIHFSRYKDLIIKHLSLPHNETFGELLYEKYVHNINTASVPIHSLHDFFWWLIFNVKYLNSSVRGALYFNDRVDWKTAIYTITNWYNDSEYQKWSMVNNNNGKKIRDTVISYKSVAKEYIFEYDKNPYYKNFKTKLESLRNIGNPQNLSGVEKKFRPVNRVGLTRNFEMLYLEDKSVRDFFRQHLMSYKIDWA